MSVVTVPDQCIIWGWIITDHVLWCQLHLGLYKEDVTLNYSVENPELCMYSLMLLHKLPLASAKMLKVLETIFDWLVPSNLGVCIGIHLNHKSSARWSQYIPQTWSKMRSANSEGVLEAVSSNLNVYIVYWHFASEFKWTTSVKFQVL